MTDLENFNTLNHARKLLWHFPCYRGLNCPNRHPKPPEDTEPHPVDERGGRTLALEFINFEDGFVFVFLSVIIIATFFASVFICGALFTNKGVKRPLNQFLISIVCTDFLMALIVVPLEMKHIFYGLDSDNSTSNGTTSLIDSSHNLAGNGENQNTDEMIVATNSESETVSVSCQTQVFFHLFVICTRSWSIAAFILLHHMHDGIIPTTHSTFVLLWTWIVAALLVLPTIIVKDSFVDFQRCGLIPQNYGMIIYVSVMLFFLPAILLAPIFIKSTKINKQFNIRRDISSDFLDRNDPNDPIDEESDEEGKVEFDLRPEVVQIIENDETSKFSSRSESLSSLEQAHRPSVATLEFLKTDTNLPRTLFTLSITNIIAWLPFILVLLMAKFLIFDVAESYATDVAESYATLKVIFNSVLWWGFAQSPLTSALIYLLSDRVGFVLSGQFKGVTVASLHKRARLMSRRFTMSD